MIPLYRCPNYSASKAALHHWLLVLRWQLRDTNVKVIEIFPPAVQSKSSHFIQIKSSLPFSNRPTNHPTLLLTAELHDAKFQPDIIDGRNLGMPLKDFTDEVKCPCPSHYPFFLIIIIIIIHIPSY